jgi:hypothetical protein
MADPLRARAGVLHSLVAVLKKRPQAEALLAKLAGKSFDRVMRLPGIGWVDEADFMAMLEVCHRELGEVEYQRTIHAACMIMLTTGIVRAARAASDAFVTPSVGGYARWTPRVWGLCFQGLQLEYGDRDGDLIRMHLRQPPSGRFSRPIVIGAAGVVQVVFTLARKPGTVRPAPFREGDERVTLLLQKAAIARSA